MMSPPVRHAGLAASRVALGVVHLTLCCEIYGIPEARAYNPASIRERGSRKSRKASPMKLKDSTASITASAGKSTRCGASNKWERASLSMEPQLGVGGGTPNPRKLMVA